jgi:hypothetical protein
MSVPNPAPNPNSAKIGYPIKCRKIVKTIKLKTMIIPISVSKICEKISIKKSSWGTEVPRYGLAIKLI